MSQSQFSFTCNSFQNHLCNGLSSLQQKQEFVDMTLAADGHFVKVHQIIMSLASPYLKELITSAPCPHPVVFLNHISHKTLCLLLEYIYSGEVVVNKEDFNSFCQAANVLHVNGLENFYQHNDNENASNYNVISKNNAEDNMISDSHLAEPTAVDVSSSNNEDAHYNMDFDNTNVTMIVPEASESIVLPDDSREMNKISILQVAYPEYEEYDQSDNHINILDNSGNAFNVKPITDTTSTDSPSIRYTLSNQGNIQMIVNRYVYYLRYNYKKSNNPTRLWRCVDYIRTRCPATVTTRDDIVIMRVAAHKHGFHDKKILKKLQTSTIFTTLKDAEVKGNEYKITKDSD